MLRPGTVVALTGPSGVGKTTALEVVLGLLRPDERPRDASTASTSRTSTPRPSGRRSRGCRSDPCSSRGRSRELVGGDAAAREAGRRAHRARRGRRRPPGRLGDAARARRRGALSLGQRQRVALTRTLLSDAPLVVLDEPTAHLDAAGEQVVLDTVRALRDAGRTVLLVAHRPSLVAAADEVVRVRSAGGGARVSAGRCAARSACSTSTRAASRSPLLLGTLALGCGVALAAVSAWLIARASQMPPVLQLSVATVAVRAFGIGRGVLRYLERLVSHDVALRGMTQLRTTLYERLAVARPETLLRLRRGDLLARVGADVDTVGDVVVRGLLPAGGRRRARRRAPCWRCALFWPPAGLALAACLAAGRRRRPRDRRPRGPDHGGARRCRAGRT